MKFPWIRSHQTSTDPRGLQEAHKALQESTLARKRIEQKSEGRDSLARTLRHLREQNNFSVMLDRAVLGRNQHDSDI